MPVDMSRKGLELVKRMHVGGLVGNSWIGFDHVECLKDCIT